jgi:hypothetical protein
MRQSNENLLGFVLNALDEKGQREVEAYLAGSLGGQERAEGLRRAVEPLSADAEETPPPPDLLYRTLALVAEHASRPDAAHDLPRAPAASRVQVQFRTRWRRAELLVAASIVLVALGGLISGLLELRKASGYVECKNNLRVFYNALAAYHDGHGHFPDVKAEAPHDVAGMAVPMLVNARLLDPGHVNFGCPGSGGWGFPVSYEDAKELAEEDFSRVAPRLMPCYAYSLGYIGEDGSYHPPHRRSGADFRIPLMSDRPPYASAANSPNHDGKGQNVLFQDGHVDYRRLRSLDRDDDIFANSDHEVHAGRGLDDYCLGTSVSRP